MTRRDIFIQIILEASGFSTNTDSDSDYAVKFFQAIAHNIAVDAPLPDHEAEELIALFRPQIPGIRLWFSELWNKAEADIAEQQGRMN